MAQQIYISSIKSKIATALYVGLFYLFLYIPISVLILFSFNKDPLPAPWSGFTLLWYKQLWYGSHELWAALYNSFVVASVTTALSLVMAMALVVAAVQHERVKRVLALFYANLIVPEIVLAVGLLSLFTLFSIPLGKITLVAAHTVLGLGYAVPILYVRYQELDYRLFEASLDLGATPAQTLRLITLPLLRPALLVAGLLVFIISFDDFVLSYFCTGPTAQTLPVYILSLLRGGVSPVVNALSTGLLVISSILVIFFCSLAIRMKVW
jgi:spermidine/putrescine transport system permease protein